MKIIKHSALFIILALFVSSCLTVEKKQYKFEMKDSHSGTLTITYINIMSMKNDTADVSSKDFDELLSSYINGTEIENNYQSAIVRSKRLYEHNGQLYGEVVIDFTNLKSVGLYQYDNKCPYMYSIGTGVESETFLGTSGEFGGDYMPVVFWPKTDKILSLTTHITTPDETCTSLLAEYKKWK